MVFCRIFPRKKKFIQPPPSFLEILKNILYICRYVMTLHANRVISTVSVGLPGAYSAGEWRFEARISPPLAA